MRLLMIDGNLVSVTGKAIEIPDSAGGVYQLVVETSAGASVTATKDTATVSGTADTSGSCTLTFYEPGTWNVTSTANGLSNTQSIVIGTQSMDLHLIDPVFANNTWARIIEACQAGQVPSAWAVGDSKTMTINGTEYQIDIIGKEHDDYADGSGKAPLTLQLHDCYGTAYAMAQYDTNYGGWKNSVMRQTHLPAILALMPTEVQNGIRAVNKLTEIRSENGILTTADKLFLLCEEEIFGTLDSLNSYAEHGEGTQYAYYEAGNSKSKQRNGAAAIWWERSPTKSSYSLDNFCNVSTTGYSGSAKANVEQSVSFAFCF